jgi:hypothetical protein
VDHRAAEGAALITGTPAMKELLLDGESWQTQDDVYDAFFRAVGAVRYALRTTTVMSGQNQCRERETANAVTRNHARVPQRAQSPRAS